MEYFAVALISLGYQISYEYSRLAKLAPFNLANITRNAAIRVLSKIGGFACFVFAIYSGVTMWGWAQGLLLTLLVFPVIWNVLFRLTSGGNTLAIWVILAWIASPIGVYILITQ